MKKILKGLTRILPAYGIFPVIFSFVFNCLVYSGSRMIAGGWYHHNIETAVDRSLPFVPQFLIIYFGCYLFWAVNYILIARQDRYSVYQFFTGDFISRCICLGFFLLYPTTNTRPVITDGGLWNQLALWLYSIDAADNLFPSIHCLVSWFCYLGHPRKKRNSGMVPERVGSAGNSCVCLYIADETACSGGRGRRNPSCRTVFLYRKKHKSVQNLRKIWQQDREKDSEIYRRVSCL